ncbi:MAG: hypothetical protein KY428_12180 [Bacteroidetes bacterium]|nr:hypothetical protein [Bacteroidota bacterium]
MSLPKLSIEAERISNPELVYLKGVTGFTVENRGNSKIWIGFSGNATGKAIDLEPGQDRLFSGATGAVFEHTMEISFDSSEVPEGVPVQHLCLIIKQILKNC